MTRNLLKFEYKTKKYRYHVEYNKFIPELRILRYNPLEEWYTLFAKLDFSKPLTLIKIDEAQSYKKIAAHYIERLEKTATSILY